jgi:acyl-CoA dehydrogenase
MSSTDPHAAFRATVQAFLDTALTPELRAAGRRMTSYFCDPRDSLPWQRILHAKGWAAPAWPVAYGGTGWSEAERAIFAEACARAEAPNLSPMGLRMIGPALIAFGDAAQKARYLPRILSGEDYWCQGYSEPQAGSDLATLTLKAVRDGDHYVLDGAKIWTTHAHHANRMFCLARTSSSDKPQRGITFLLLDMASPGITVEPIITLAGEHELNAVFFDQVRVPVADRLGREDEGWTVAKYLLEFERSGSMAPQLWPQLQRARDLAEAGDAEPALRTRLAEAEIALIALGPRTSGSGPPPRAAAASAPGRPPSRSATRR